MYATEQPSHFGYFGGPGWTMMLTAHLRCVLVAQSSYKTCIQVQAGTTSKGNHRVHRAYYSQEIRASRPYLFYLLGPNSRMMEYLDSGPSAVVEVVRQGVISFLRFGTASKETRSLYRIRRFG